MRDTSCLLAPIPDHAFFEQAVVQRQLGHDLLEGQSLTAQALDFIGCRLAGGIARQALLARLQELLRPAIIEVLVDPLPPA